ncbi:MAG: outer membrane protein assembly factor BamE [Sinobacterium sp.]|nr:outer membrane protein assembly factor BamE [Sinobacterium sp.]
MLKQVMKSINPHKLNSWLAIVFLALFCTACSTSHFPWVYRVDIEQGNIVDDDKLAEVVTGMSKAQIKYLLGTPLIQDTFDESRWDYFYSFRTGKGHYESRRVTLIFEGDNLSSIENIPPKEMDLKYW